MALNSSLEYDITDSELRMPNGSTLYVTEGSIPVVYSIQPREPDVGITSAWADWDVDADTIPLTAVDEDERTIRLELPLRHPAIRDLLDRYDDSIHDACMSDEDDYGGPDPDDWRDSWRDSALTEGF